jgi:HSP20 family protein
VEVCAALPDIYPDDVDITVVGDTLTIKAHHVTSEEDARPSYYIHEVPYGEWQRTFSLPVAVEADKPRRATSRACST